MAVVDLLLFFCCFLLFCLGLKDMDGGSLKQSRPFGGLWGFSLIFFFFHFLIFAPFILGRRIRSPNFLPSRTVEWPGCHVQILCEGDGHSSWWVKGSSPGDGGSPRRGHMCWVLPVSYLLSPSQMRKPEIIQISPNYNTSQWRRNSESSSVTLDFSS